MPQIIFFCSTELSKNMLKQQEGNAQETHTQIPQIKKLNFTGAPSQLNAISNPVNPSPMS